MELDFDKLDGLLARPIVQDARTGEVLMLGFMNEQAYAETRSTGAVTFFSRSRGKLWRKGEQSGHTLRVREVRVDCDAGYDAGARRSGRAGRLPRRLPKLLFPAPGRRTARRTLWRSAPSIRAPCTAEGSRK